jgi:hypothetical protein
MSGLRWLAAVMVVLVGAAVAPPAGAAGQAETPPPPAPVTVTELVTDDGTALQSAVKINERGDVLGHVVNADPGGLRPAIWRRGAPTRLAPDGVVAFGSDLTERGEAIGFERGPQLFQAVPFSWSRNGWRRLPTAMPTGWALDANDRGQVLGGQTESLAEPTETVVWDRGERVTPPPGMPLVGAPLVGTGHELINNQGQAAVGRLIDGPCGPASPCTIRAAIWAPWAVRPASPRTSTSAATSSAPATRRAVTPTRSCGATAR